MSILGMYEIFFEFYNFERDENFCSGERWGPMPLVKKIYMVFDYI